MKYDIYRNSLLILIFQFESFVFECLELRESADALCLFLGPSLVIYELCSLCAVLVGPLHSMFYISWLLLESLRAAD